MKTSIHIFLVASILWSFGLYAQDSLNVNKLGRFDYSVDLSDIWGYAGNEGKEYALVGLRNGVSIVNITQAPVLNEIIRIPGVPSIWRDLKTWGHHAYVTHDITRNPATMPAQGLLVINMDSIDEGRIPTYQYLKLPIPINGGFDTLKTAHNLYIDENGICYIFGANVGNGGALMFDLNSNPWNPMFIGLWDEDYLHDGVVRGDTLWGSAVFAGNFVVVDVSNKAFPITQSARLTPAQFTHNAWFSGNNKYLFTTDEVAAAPVTAYDVSNINNIREIDQIRSSLNPQAIPHNAHWHNNFLVNSYYTSGVQIVDVREPDMMVEVGYYDTSPNFSDDTFNGCWGAYPWLPSGRILASDMQEGLYVLSSTYPRASHLRLHVRHAITKVPIPAALFSSNGQSQGTSNINGNFKQGLLLNGLYNITVSASGFNTENLSMPLMAGQTLVDTLDMLPMGIGLSDLELTDWRIYPNPVRSVLHFELGNGLAAELQLMDMSGRILANYIKEEGTKDFNWNLEKMASGQYLLRLKQANKMPQVKILQISR